jgi:GNAT superfamily N-acetyltransferase
MTNLRSSQKRRYKKSTKTKKIKPERDGERCMRVEFDEFIINDDKGSLNIETIKGFLSRSYWANNRSPERIEQSINNSICYGVFHGSRQIAFARVVTDDATIYWLADVFVDEEYRGRGIGKKFIQILIHSERLKDLMGVLGTKDAHEIYEEYGFIRDNERFMKRLPDYLTNKAKG